MLSTLAILAVANANGGSFLALTGSTLLRPESCTMSDGITQREVGYTGNDVGPNSCNTCSCVGKDNLMCLTEDFCGCIDNDCGAIEDPCAIRVNGKTCGETCCAKADGCAWTGKRCVTEDHCTLSDSNTGTVTKVPQGWTGHDVGFNSCNVCRCNEDTTLTCTQKICWDGVMIHDPKPGCILSDRVTEVLFGWEGDEVGKNDCKFCQCTEEDGLTCDRPSCTEEPTAQPTADPTPMPTLAPTNPCGLKDTKAMCKATPLCRWGGNICKDVLCPDLKKSKCRNVLGCVWTGKVCEYTA